MTEKTNPIVPCKKCGALCSGTFFKLHSIGIGNARSIDPVNLERLCVNCAYEIWKKDK